VLRSRFCRSRATSHSPRRTSRRCRTTSGCIDPRPRGGERLGCRAGRRRCAEAAAGRSHRGRKCALNRALGSHDAASQAVDALSVRAPGLLRHDPRGHIVAR
jgi:hypothetical protein